MTGFMFRLLKSKARVPPKSQTQTQLPDARAVPLEKHTNLQAAAVSIRLEKKIEPVCHGTLNLLLGNDMRGVYAALAIIACIILRKKYIWLCGCLQNDFPVLHGNADRRDHLLHDNRLHEDRVPPVDDRSSNGLPIKE